MARSHFSAFKYGFVASILLAASSLSIHAQTVAETSLESRFQLDCHVPDATLRALLPAGFTSAAATAGPAKDANLRVVFIDRIAVRGPNGKVLGTGSSQLVYLVASIKDAAGVDSQLVVGGMDGDASDVPGPFGNYLPATTHTMHRSVSSGTGPIVETQDWVFAAATGEHLEMHIEFERGPGFKIGMADVNFYSQKTPAYYQISRQEQVLDILKNVTTTPPDRVKKFSFKASGGTYEQLLGGKEKLLSWDNILWMNRTVLLP